MRKHFVEIWKFPGQIYYRYFAVASDCSSGDFNWTEFFKKNQFGQFVTSYLFSRWIILILIVVNIPGAVRYSSLNTIILNYTVYLLELYNEYWLVWNKTSITKYLFNVFGKYCLRCLSFCCLTWDILFCNQKSQNDTFST